METTEEKERRKIDEQKRVFDEVTKQWLDDKFATFGRFTFRTILAIVFVIGMRFLFHINYHDLRTILEDTTSIKDITN